MLKIDIFLDILDQFLYFQENINSLMISTDHTYIQELVRTTLKDLDDKSHLSGNFTVNSGIALGSIPTETNYNKSFFTKLKEWLV